MNIFFRSCSKVKLWKQNKERIFEADKDEYALRFRLAARSIGKSVELSVLRRGITKSVQFKLIAPPEKPLRNETVFGGRNPFSGLKVVNLSPAVLEEHNLRGSPVGVLVVAVKRGSLAMRLGFKPGDVFIKINRNPVTRVRDMKRILRDEPRPWMIDIRRGRKTLQKEIG